MAETIVYKIENFMIAIAIPLILYIVLLVMAPKAMGGTQIFDILRQAMLPAVLAWGVAFACKLGLWHFAAGANVISGIIIGAGIGCRLGGSPAVIAVSIVAASTLIGLACGLIYIWIKVPSIIATVGCMLVLESISALAWGGGGITVSKDYAVFNSIAVVIICTVISFVIAYILYARTKYGFHLKAVSNNINVSEQQGIDVRKVKVLSFLLVGFFSGIYGMLTLARSFKQVPTTNMGSMDMVFHAIMCFFVAAAIEKHVNLMVGVYIGSLTVQLIKFGIVALGISGQFNNAAVAVALLIFCVISSESEPVMKLKARLWVRKAE
ncbi:MAG: hypothetical protein OSJ53_12845 [Kineothrix sp.]|nr:hypothetical protein [Kineothrix sp.]